MGERVERLELLHLVVRREEIVLPFADERPDRAHLFESFTIGNPALGGEDVKEVAVDGREPIAV